MKMLKKLVSILLTAAICMGCFTVPAFAASVAKPTYSVKGSAGVRKIKLSTTTSGATIYYTTNGTTPTIKSKKYTSGTLIKITKDTKIKAIAVYGNISSAVMAKTFKVSTKYGDITGDGNINQNDYSRLKNYLDEKTSYICKDNADCDGNGKIDENDLTLFKRYLDGKISSLPYTNSSSSSTSTSLPRPGITVYKSDGGKSITFDSSIKGVTFYYTLNGKNPTTSSTKYTKKFLINKIGKTTVKVIAYKDGVSSDYQTTTVNVTIADASRNTKIKVEDMPYTNENGFSGTYSGQIMNSLPSGEGVYKFIDFHDNEKTDIVYSGQWLDGKLNGQGKMQFTSNSQTSFREGIFKDGKLNGQGTINILYSSNNTRDIFDGEFKDGNLVKGAFLVFQQGHLAIGMYGTFNTTTDSNGKVNQKLVGGIYCEWDINGNFTKIDYVGSEDDLVEGVHLQERYNEKWRY